MLAHRRILLLLLLLWTSAQLSAQILREPKNFSNDPGNAYSFVALSPDGRWVLAIGGPGGANVGVIQWDSTNSFNPWGPNASTSFDHLWQATSGGIYYVETNAPTTELRYRGNSGNRTVAQVPASFRLHDTDATDGFLIGTVLLAGGNRDIVRIPTTGIGGLLSLTGNVGFAGVVDELSLDPSDTRILFRLWSGVPATPVDYFAINAAGGGVTRITPTSVATRANGVWVVGATAIAYEESAGGFSHIYRQNLVDPGPVRLTAGARTHRNLSISDDQSLLAFEVSDSNVNPVEIVPAVMPTDGGGIVLMTVHKRFPFSSGPGGLSFGAPPTPRFAFAARENGAGLPQIFGVELESELLISPTLGPGVTLMANMVNSGSQVAGFMAFGRVHVVLGGIFPNPLLVDLSLYIQLFSGAPNGSGSLAIPADASLVGLNVYFQGATVFPSLGIVSFSRLVEATLQ